ncbi:MAG: radical SAM protein [Candidatus Xenobiia bacterium LiM19]
MKAEIKPNYDKDRKKLADIIPIPAPFTVYIEQTRVCNLKCFYCIHSTRDNKDGEFRKLNYDIKHMDFDLYRDIIKQLSEFPEGSIKRIVFSGLGEPLTNPRLPEMIKIAADSKIANRIEIITNGILLTPDLCDQLVNTGITNINISIQGINDEHYFEVCGKKVDFEKLVENLKYLYTNRRDVKIYIKAIDAAIRNKEEEAIFYDTFSPLADRIFIEHLVQMQQQMTQLKPKVDGSKNFYGEELDLNRKVCGQSFYFLQIGCDLDTFPCPVPGLSRGLSMGNIVDNKIIEIWNGQKRKNLLKTMLKLEKDSIPECCGCTCFNAINNTAENLDEDAPRLLKLFEQE